MKKLFTTPKVFLIGIIILNNFINVNAQNIIQKTGIPASKNTKIDGELNEWDNKLPYHNNSTDIFYALSNDDKNLYLSVQVVDVTAIQKIIANGLSFTLFGANKDTKAVITFPVLRNKTGRIVNDLKAKVDDSGMPLSANQIDSLTNEMNRQLTEKSKEIMVTGINGIADTIISIYNENRVKTAARFTNNKVLNYELSLPITLIQPQINSEGTINYNIQLNGISNNTISFEGNDIIISTPGTDRKVGVTNTPELLKYILGNVSTDFSGKYTLAKQL